jgi:outer membrane protein TolC
MFTVRPLLAAPLCAWFALTSLPAGAQTPEAGASPVESARPHPETQAVAPLTLEQAVSLAAERNERTLAAQQRAEAAEARVDRARAFFFPELTLTGTYTRRVNPTGAQRSNALGATAVARVTLFDARGFPLYRAARLEGEAAELESLEARRLVGFEAADAFLTTLGSQQVYEAAVRRLEFSRQNLQDAKARAEAGLASTNDVTRAELEVASAEVQLAEARGSAETSRLELGYLLVSPVEGPLALPEPLLGEALRPDEGLLARVPGAEDRRLDVLSARLRVEALEASAREPLARLFPTLGLSGQYRLTNETGPNNIPGLLSNQGTGFIALELAWNLFDGGERYAERRERVALAKAAQLESTARTRRVEVDIERARVELRNAQAALKQSELATEQARKNAEETGILYRQGLSTALAVSDAALRLFEAEVSLARARYSLGVALLDLRAAVGLDPLGKEPQQ